MFWTGITADVGCRGFYNFRKIVAGYLMIVVIGTFDTPRLDDVENFKQFKIVAPAKLIGSEYLTKQINMLGSMDENGNHVWVSVPKFMSLFGSGRSESWLNKFSEMLQGVAKYGFINADRTAFRSHIEAL